MTLVTKTVLAGGIAIAGLVGYLLYNGSRFSVEQIPYTVEASDGGFEVRRYPSINVASAEAAAGDGSDAFMPLFQFISGANARNEKIPMTAPVLFDGPARAQRKMSFALPPAIQIENVPAPDSAAVKTSRVRGGRIATYRFSGEPGAEAEKAAIATLREWIQRQGLNADGDPIIAYYDAPFVPSLLRRNEAMLRIQP